MTARDEQKAYNWVYGILKGMVRMLPFSRPSMSNAPLQKYKEGFPKKIGPYLVEAAGQLELLSKRTGSACFSESSQMVLGASERCFGLAQLNSRDAFEAEIDALIPDIASVLRKLDAESAIKYRLWWFNPAQHYPRKLTAI